MDNRPKGPYKHYERPTDSRVADDEEAQAGGHWGAVISVLIIILAVLIPVVHHFAAKNIQHTEQPTEVQKVSKKKSNSKKVFKIKKSKKSKLKKSSKKKTQSSQSSSSDNISNSSQSSTKNKTYVVQDGDTLSSIAEQNGMSVEQLAQLNNLDSDANIAAGDTLKLK